MEVWGVGQRLCSFAREYTFNSIMLPQIRLIFRGITNIRLIDFDRVTMSSLNRHATATLSDVGLSKVHAMKSALIRISLKVEVDVREELWTKEEGGSLLEGMDFVIGMSFPHKKYLSVLNLRCFMSLRCNRQYYYQS